MPLPAAGFTDVTIESALAKAITCLQAAHAEVAVGLADPASAQPHLSCHLAELLPAAPSPNQPGFAVRQSAVSLTARCLVTAHAPDPTRALALLSQALLAAADDPGMTIDLAPPDPAFWLAAGRPPQPCFWLRLPVLLAATRPAAPRVARTAVRLAGMGRLAGRLVTAQGQGVARADLTLPELDLTTRSDDDGGFAFAGVASGGPARLLVIAAAGLRQTTRVAPSDQPVTLIFTPEGI